MSDRVKNIKKELLSDNWYHLYRLSFDYKNNAGSWQSYQREAYDRGNGATILLYNSTKNSVILTRQFRMPTFINGNADGHLIEACAGLLDNDNPIVCIKKETEEETGFRLNKVTKIFEAYMSPGSVTEVLHFFIAEYDEQMKVSEGGGCSEEQENIEVLEFTFEKALNMIYTGEIKDAKTIMLLQYAQIHELLTPQAHSY